MSGRFCVYIIMVSRKKAGFDWRRQSAWCNLEASFARRTNDWLNSEVDVKRRNLSHVTQKELSI